MAGSKAGQAPSPYWIFAATGLAFIAGCAALAPLAMQFGADLISSASNNYSQQYARQLEGLLLAVYTDKAAKKKGQTEVAQAGAYPAYPGGASPYGNPGDPYGTSGAYPPSGGAYPSAGGAYPPSGGAYPSAGGAYPPSGGAYPAAGGTQPYGTPQSPYPSYPSQPDPYAQGGAAYPQAGGAYPQAGGAYPQAGGAYPSGAQSAYPVAAGGAYPNAAVPYGAVASSIVFDTALLAQRATDRAARRADPVPIQDGETLRDGGSDPRKGDVLKFSFRVNCDCYVYVIGADATGYVARIFPDPASGTNPVRANQQYVVPQGTAWYGLDQYKGVEQVFFIASRGPRQDIENPLNQLAQTARASLTKNFRAVREAVTSNAATRGLVKVQMPAQDTVQGESGQRFSFTPQAFAAQPGSDDIVITRWFNHE